MPYLVHQLIMGTNQLPKPPIKAGITIKKYHNKCMSSNYNIIIIDNFHLKYWTPGYANSIRIISEKKVPITADTAPKIIYNVPISLWLVEPIQREIKGVINFTVIVFY